MRLWMCGLVQKSLYWWGQLFEGPLTTGSLNALYRISFEGVCVLPSSWPPACVEGGVRASVFDTTSPAAVAPVSSSKNADLAAIYATLAPARSPNRACHPMGPHMDPLGPKALQMDPKGVPRRPTGVQRPVKGDPKAPKGNQRETKVAPKASQWDPRGGPRRPKGAQAGPTI